MHFRFSMCVFSLCCVFFSHGAKHSPSIHEWGAIDAKLTFVTTNMTKCKQRLNQSAPKWRQASEINENLNLNQQFRFVWLRFHWNLLGNGWERRISNLSLWVLLPLFSAVKWKFVPIVFPVGTSVCKSTLRHFGHLALGFVCPWR